MRAHSSRPLQNPDGFIVDDLNHVSEETIIGQALVFDCFAVVILEVVDVTGVLYRQAEDRIGHKIKLGAGSAAAVDYFEQFDIIKRQFPVCLGAVDVVRDSHLI